MICGVGIENESFVFPNDDVAGLTVQEIERLVRTPPMVKEGAAMILC